MCFGSSWSSFCCLSSNGNDHHPKDIVVVVDDDSFDFVDYIVKENDDGGWDDAWNSSICVDDDDDYEKKTEDGGDTPPTTSTSSPTSFGQDDLAQIGEDIANCTDTNSSLFDEVKFRFEGIANNQNGGDGVDFTVNVGDEQMHSSIVIDSLDGGESKARTFRRRRGKNRYRSNDQLIVIGIRGLASVDGGGGDSDRFYKINKTKPMKSLFDNIVKQSEHGKVYFDFQNKRIDSSLETPVMLGLTNSDIITMKYFEDDDTDSDSTSSVHFMTSPILEKAVIY